MQPSPEIVARTIELAVAPVFLLAGIGGFLNVTAGRLARVIDRARTLEERVLEDGGESEAPRQVWELKRLNRRMTVVNLSIALSVASAVAICAVVIMLFAAELKDGDYGNAIALTFIAAMLLLAASFVTFMVEIWLASKTIHVRRDALAAADERP